MVLNDGTRRWRLIAKGVVLATAVLAMTAWLHSPAEAVDDPSARERIARHIRERFGLLDNVRLTVQPLREFANPDFLQTTVVVEEGTQRRPQNVILTRDKRFMFIGNAVSLGANPSAEIAAKVRQEFKIPTASEVRSGPLRQSPIPSLMATTVTVTNGRQKQEQDFFVTRDSSYLLLATPFDLAVDPRQQVLGTVITAGHPGKGPASAPVTIVEYADLQCAACARMHEFLEKELIPAYGSNQCAYQIKPEAYSDYRGLIMKNQGALSAANARDRLIDLAGQVGIDRLKLAACLDSKATLARVEQNFQEGQAIGVQSTPTTFINGRRVVGVPPRDVFFKIVDEALREAR
jgi:protein-disulfide isomerase